MTYGVGCDDGGGECMAALKGDGCDDGCEAVMDECVSVVNDLQVSSGTGMIRLQYDRSF